MLKGLIEITVQQDGNSSSGHGLINPHQQVAGTVMDKDELVGFHVGVELLHELRIIRLASPEPAAPDAGCVAVGLSLHNIKNPCCFAGCHTAQSDRRVPLEAPASQGPSRYSQMSGGTGSLCCLRYAVRLVCRRISQSWALCSVAKSWTMNTFTGSCNVWRVASSEPRMWGSRHGPRGWARPWRAQPQRDHGCGLR